MQKYWTKSYRCPLDIYRNMLKNGEKILKDHVKIENKQNRLVGSKSQMSYNVIKF